VVLSDVVNLYYTFLRNRSVACGGWSLSHCIHAIDDWSITANSGNTTAESGAGKMAAACAAKSRTAVKPSRSGGMAFFYEKRVEILTIWQHFG